MISSTISKTLPHGCQIFSSMPEILFIPEFVIGGLVWTLVASTRVVLSNPLGWVMFVSILCFVMTTIWFFIFILGKNQTRIWPSLDVGCHAIAALIYLSAAIILAYVTFIFKTAMEMDSFLATSTSFFSVYQRSVAAVVMAFMTTLLYIIHAVFSARRWKSFP